LAFNAEQIVAAAGDDPLSDVGLGPDPSMVTSAPVNCNRSSSSGMAVIAKGSFTSTPVVRFAQEPVIRARPGSPKWRRLCPIFRGTLLRKHSRGQSRHAAWVVRSSVT